jgi:hypothetical protein
MKTILFSLALLFIILLPELKAQEAVRPQPATRTEVRYNKYEDKLDIRVVQDAPVINYETGKYFFPSSNTEYKPWENDYIDIQNIYKFNLIMNDVNDIYDPIPVIIEGGNGDGY